MRRIPTGKKPPLPGTGNRPENPDCCDATCKDSLQVGGSVRIDAYGVIEHAVDEGIEVAWKYIPRGDPDAEGWAKETLLEEIMNALCVVLSFDKGENDGTF